MARRKNPFPGVSRVTDRHGKARWRFRRGNVDTYLRGKYNSAEFRAEYEAALEGVTSKKRSYVTPAEPGTFEWLIRHYRTSAKYRDLAPITRKNRDSELEWLRTHIGGMPFARFELRHVEAVMHKKAGPSAANKIKKRLSALFNYAIRLELLQHNPAKLAEKRKENPNGYYTASDADIERLRAHYASGTKARLLLELVLNTGAARQDLAGLGWQNVRDGRIAYRRGKSNEATSLPILEELATELQHVPDGHMLFITHGAGRGYTAEGLGNWFRDRLREAGIERGNLHSFRKAGATRLANAGATENEIAAYLAHSDTRQASVYTKAANRERLTDSAFGKLPGTKIASNLSNHPNGLDKVSNNTLKPKEK